MRGREGGRSRRDRAQTAQDFALGIGFFMIAVAFVFAFVPSMLAFTTADPGAKAASQEGTGTYLIFTPARSATSSITSIPKPVGKSLTVML